MKRKEINEEIDLIQVSRTIVENKIKFFLFIIIPIIISLIYSFNDKPKYHSTSEIIPIDIIEENKFISYNVNTLKVKEHILSFFKNSKNNFPDKTDNLDKINNLDKTNILDFDLIDREYLLSLFLEKLNDREILIQAIEKSKLIDKKNYKDKKKYEEDLKKLASSINLIPPINEEDKLNNIKYYWTIEFDIYDKIKLNDFLQILNKNINEELTIFLKNKFYSQFESIAKEEKNAIEDINRQIKDSNKNYILEINNRLEFLKEQAILAKTLGIIENLDQSVAVYFEPKEYYKRGFKVIEKEIENIKNRKNLDLFNKELLELKKKRRELINNNIFQRLEKAFNNTPILVSNDFYLAKIDDKNTKYKNLSLGTVALSLMAGIIGFIIGIFFIIISNKVNQVK